MPPAPPVNKRRAEILAKAAALFAKQGVATTTVREIADSVGILSGSLYHHFQSKEEMVEEIIAAYLDDLLASYREVARTHDDPRQCLEQLVRASFTSLETHTNACEIYQNDHKYLARLPRYTALRQVSQATQRVWIDTIEAGVANGEFRKDVDPAVFYRFLRDAIWMSIRWRRPGAKRNGSDLAEQCIAIFVEGYARFDLTRSAAPRSVRSS
jgi:TetR/AcrR family transcriptional regulator, cholesterol catabolism regulator